MKTSEKLAKLRALMKADGVSALYVSTADPHQSESVSAHWKAVQWLTGFTGSMGYALVTPEKAEFWTDGRYITQALKEIEADTFHANNISVQGTPKWHEWLLKELAEGDVLAVDGEVLSEAMRRDFLNKLPIKDLKIKHDRNYLDEIWVERPEIPKNPVWEMPEAFRGQTRAQKLEALRERLKKVGADPWTLVCCLDDIAWLTNLRGGDNPLYPFFHAYALISMGEAHLCTNLYKLSEEIKSNLIADGWQLHEYGQMGQLLQGLPAGSSLYLDPYKTPFGLFAAIPSEVAVREGPDLVTAQKAAKSPQEQANIREANRREACAVVRFMKWIEENVQEGNLDEFQVGKKLEEFRRMDPLYLQPANIPIVGYGPNAALPHYRPNATNSAQILPVGFLLFDVCAQYQCGSTDLTRTVAVGELTDEMKRDYTITLKSHIALARQKFPYGTTGDLLDAIVKSIHWNELMTFGHGTGHGIGYVLNIHEGPAKIITEYAPAFPYALHTPVEDGMLFSDEPGVYKPGRHGIRIENSIIAHNIETNEFGRFLGFETVTYLPYERKAIVVEQLTQEEIDWINQYYEQCYRLLSPLLDKEEKAWLAEKTRPLG